MNLDRQIQLLIDDAPSDGITPRLIKAIAPGLKQLAANALRHEQYYIIQSINSDWLVTTITNGTIEKRVIYAFPPLQDSFAPSTADLIAAPIPVTHILFQLLALETVDSIVFLETPEETNTGYEVKRQDIQKLIQTQIKPNFNQIPPDIA